MVEKRTMPREPEDDLERMLAAEEQAILDDGFTRHVVEQTHRGTPWRQTVIYGAGLAGFGFAVGGIVEMAPQLPDLTGWLESVATAVQSSSLGGSVQGASDATQLTVLAIVAGLAFLVTAVAAQNR